VLSLPTPVRTYLSACNVAQRAPSYKTMLPPPRISSAFSVKQLQLLSSRIATCFTAASKPFIPKLSASPPSYYYSSSSHRTLARANTICLGQARESSKSKAMTIPPTRSSSTDDHGFVTPSLFLLNPSLRAPRRPRPSLEHRHLNTTRTTNLLFS
jgi:hypothetical protein